MTNLLSNLSRGRGSKDAAVYVGADRAFKSTLLAPALDADGTGIGPAVVEEAFAAAARHATVTCNEEMDSQRVRIYSVPAR